MIHAPFNRPILAYPTVRKSVAAATGAGFGRPNETIYAVVMEAP